MNSGSSSLLGDLLGDLAPAPRAAAERALRLLLHGLDPDAPLDRPHIDRHLTELDRRLFAQLDAILHHPAVQSLEAAWRSLDLLVDRVRFDENTRVEILPCSKQDLLDDLASAPEVTRSGLYFHVYAQAIGTFGGKPYGILAADFDFTPGAEDIALLRHCAAVAAIAHAPFITNASPAFLGLGDFAGLPRLRDLQAALAGPRFRLWHAFRATEDARYVGLCLPRVLLRAPYDVDTEPDAPLPYRETCHQHRDFLWGRPSYLFVATAAASFARHRWCVHILGTRAAASTADRALFWDYPTLSGLWHRIAFECQVTARVAHILADEGLIPFVYERATARAVLLAAPSVQRPRTFRDDAESVNEHLGAQLPYVFLVSRLAHYLNCVQRERIGQWLDRSGLERDLALVAADDVLGRR
ncbi:MAG TPA: type VI secretion system contractile sheath large subunit, partial [Nannocystaceae bacterium]|nr:type VI secretion system contractile sheath large subunit [Nannocystaceae bacterium]